MIAQTGKSGKSLLVLGEPGSGKTMFMIRLGEKLCEAAAKSAKVFTRKCRRSSPRCRHGE